MQERCNSSVSAMELPLSCTQPSIYEQFEILSPQETGAAGAVEAS